MGIVGLLAMDSMMRKNACQVKDACQATHLVSDLDRFAVVVAWVVTYIA